MKLKRDAMKEVRKNETTQPQPFNEIINYMDGMAIIKDDYGTLYYLVIEEEFVVIGEVVLQSDLNPITNLTEVLQQKILDRLGE